MKTRCGGFTLIELLVVIAIIAILAAILFPIFASAKATAVTANCQSNIKQMGIAMQLYAESNGGGLPNYSLGNGSARRMWWEFINPYLRADKIYRCPALPDSKIKTNAYDAKGNARIYGYGVSYPHLFNPGLPPPKMSAIPRASKTMLMCDDYTMEMNPSTFTIVECGYPVVYCRACGDYNYAGCTPDGNVAGRHGGRSNAQPYGKTVVLYADLHSKVWNKEYVIQKYSTRAASGNDDMWAHFDKIQR